MFKTVYSRMLWTYLVIVLASMLLLGIWVGDKFRKQYYQERVDSMVREAEEINTIIGEKYYNRAQRAVAINELQVIARKYNAYIWVVDSQGMLRINDPERETEWDENSEFNLEDSMEDVVRQGRIIKTTGFFGDAFGVPVMTVGRPLVVKDMIQGAIYIHTKMDDIQQSITAIYENVFTSALMAVMLAMGMVLVTARMFTKPLEQMNIVAQSYAKGDFSSRVPVKSQDEIGQLAASFNTMAKELKSLDDMRKSFVANASHEMKAPLAAMRGFLEAILDGSVPPGEQTEYLTIVLDETKRLSNLVTNLLDLSKIESGNFPLSRRDFDINELMGKTLLTFEGRINEKELNIEVLFREERCFVYADPDRIAQVIRNLIDNAIKFTPNYGTISLWTYTGNKKVYIAVKDSGCGIPEEDLDQIWTRFYKVEKAHTPRNDSGTGLGLSIVKKIVEQHGGEIRVTSTVGKGTNFCLTLPPAAKKAVREPSPPSGS